MPIKILFLVVLVFSQFLAAQESLNLNGSLYEKYLSKMKIAKAEKVFRGIKNSGIDAEIWVYPNRKWDWVEVKEDESGELIYQVVASGPAILRYDFNQEDFESLTPNPNLDSVGGCAPRSVKAANLEEKYAEIPVLKAFAGYEKGTGRIMALEVFMSSTGNWTFTRVTEAFKTPDPKPKKKLKSNAVDGFLISHDGAELGKSDFNPEENYLETCESSKEVNGETDYDQGVEGELSDFPDRPVVKRKVPKVEPPKTWNI